MQRLFLSALLGAFCAFALDSSAATRRPNVILFLVDDMGWVDCGAYGSKYYQTPNIDRFAARALRFTDAYAQPLCSPTRASLLTGKYSARHGITSATGHQPPQPVGFKFLPDSAPANRPLLLPESKNYLEPSEFTLAEALRAAGYRTAHLGKWHLGLTRPHWPEQQGFDVAFHCHPDPGPPGNYFSPYSVARDGEPRGPSKVGTITDGPPGEYIVDRLADEAVKFIEANRDRPFFLNLWQYGVHGPWGHKTNYTQQFVGKTDPRGKQGNPIMASMLRSVDESFGRILDTLDRLKLADDTIVIFNSDNGGNTHSNVPDTGKTAKAEQNKSPLLTDWRKWAGDLPPTNNDPLRDGKGTLYEGGTRVPLMWAWAGRIKPGLAHDVVGHIDLYPTVLELAGLPRPAEQKFDGVSYARVLRGEGRLERAAFFNYFPHGRNGGGVWVRAGDWKLIRWFDPGTPRELFNLKDDLSEAKNLADAQPAKVKELDALIDDFLRDTGASYPRPNPAYKIAAATPTPTPAPANANAADPLDGWKARQCEAVVKDGVVTVTGKAGAFLGHGMGKLTGPATLKFRARSAAGGAGKVEWLPGGATDAANAQSVPYDLPAGDWREVSVNLATTGPLGVLRLYLPAASKPVELDWIEISPKAGKPQRWDFDKP
ncbi:MAG: sulfatase [Limisphaerales bacterium]